jgi:hypothetical protein
MFISRSRVTPSSLELTVLGAACEAKCMAEIQASPKQIIPGTLKSTDLRLTWACELFQCV